MLIRLALWLFVLSLPFFLLAFTLKIAAFLLLSAFGLLIIGGLLSVLRLLFMSIKTYFSAPQRENRRLLFTLNQKNNRERLFYFRRLQLSYFKERQRKNILAKNNRAQINALSNSIERELFGVKHKLSKDRFTQLQLENRRYRKQQNEQALLELHTKISSLAGN